MLHEDIIFSLYVLCDLSNIIRLQDPSCWALQGLCGGTKQVSRIKVEKVCSMISVEPLIEGFVAGSLECRSHMDSCQCVIEACASTSICSGGVARVARSHKIDQLKLGC